MVDALSQYSVDDLVEQWSSAETALEAFDVYARVIAEYGYDQINYFSVGRSRHSPETPRNAVNALVSRHTHTYSDSWASRYEERDYYTIDPVFALLKERPHAFRWATIGQLIELSNPQVTFMDESRDAGLRDGFSVPLYGPYNEFSALCIARSIANPSDDMGYQVGSMLSYQFHSIYMSLSDQETDVDEALGLTYREHEVLLWCAQGKSNWTIGEILGISAHGVRFHIQNIYKKLDANSRIAAVVKAIRLGLIQP